ncbi:ABC transporter substrate-binding protein [Microbacterium aurantiacum]|uniref:ABC transporter substrate-binding protein n=1 Tax=Microbacterium aurantiacum TaxID=162393 RepID=UPI004036DC1E
MHITRHIVVGAAMAVAATLTLTACSADAGGDTPTAADGEPIVVSAVSSLAFFPEAPEAVQAVFDDYNAAGGLGGRPLQYEVLDDKVDPAASATAAQDVISSDAVALVGGSSLLDCQINGATWAENGIVSIQGTGVDPYCFASANIAPTNTGPYFDSFAALTYGSEELGYEAICAVYTPDSPAIQSAFEQAFTQWSDATGKELAYVDDTLTRGQPSYAGNVSNLKSQGCDAILEGDTGDSVLKFLGEASNQGISLPVLALTSSFSDPFAQGSTYQGQIHIPAEFAPYFDDSIDGVAEWAETMDEHGVAKTSFAQGGYLAAQYFISILESIDGDVTRESFTEAAKGMTEPIDSPMAQAEWIFGEGDAHQPNDTAYPVVLEPGSGAWTALGPLLDGAELGWTGIVVE